MKIHFSPAVNRIIYGVPIVSALLKLKKFCVVVFRMGPELVVMNYF